MLGLAARAAVAVVFVSLVGGCYERVVGVGPGAIGDYDIYEPNYDPNKDPFNFDKPKAKSKTQAPAKPIPSQVYED